MRKLILDRAAPLTVLQSVDSTNDFLRRMAAEGAPDGAVVLSESQSAGRGRQGRSFTSPEGGLYMSMLFRPETDAQLFPTLTPAAAVAVCRAIERACSLRCGIKWPNDVVLGGKKVCGILCESVLGAAEPCVIVGIGINVNTPSFPPELEKIAGSLREVRGESLDIAALAETLVAELDAVYSGWLEDPFFAAGEYRRRCVSCGRDVLVGDKAGFAQSVGDDYSLLVAYPDGSFERVRFGEVSVRGLYGYV